MKEYQALIDTYALEGYEMYSQRISDKDWGNKAIAEKYLEKYWLSYDEYIRIWKPIQNGIFLSEVESLPSELFREDYKIIVLGGGCLFLEEDFNLLRECFLAIGDKYFVVIENTFGGLLKEPSFRMKYPTSLTWADMISGNFISSVITESIHKEFFVFGESALWGKYAATDYKYPLDIIGFKQECNSIFTDKFKKLIVSNTQNVDIYACIPPLYQQKT